jgi:hypothetical protein
MFGASAIGYAIRLIAARRRLAQRTQTAAVDQ